METVANLEKLKKPTELEFRPSQVEIGKPGVWCIKKIKEGELFGPYLGERVDVNKNININYRYAWEVFDPATNEITHIINATKPHHGNWMRYVNCARYFEEQNIVSVQLGEDIFYKTIKDIEVDEELLTWFDLYDRNDQTNTKPDKKKKHNENKPKTSKKSGATKERNSSQSPRRKIQPCITASLLQKKTSPQKQIVPEMMNTAGKSQVSMETKSPSKCRESGKKSTPQKNKVRESPQKTAGKVRKASPSTPNLTPKNKEPVKMVTSIKRKYIDDKDSPASNSEKKKKKIIQTTVAFKISKKSSSGNNLGKNATTGNPSQQKEELHETKSDKNSKYDPQFFHFYTEMEHVVMKEGRKVYSCNLCDTIYKKPFSLKRHFLRTHINCRYIAQKDLVNCCIKVDKQQNKIFKAQQVQNSGFKLLNGFSRAPLSSATGVSDKATPARNCVNGVRETTPVKNTSFPGLYKCDMCYFLFDEMSELSVHINNKHKNDGKPSANSLQTKNKKSNKYPTIKPESKNSKMVGSMLRKIFSINSQQEGENILENSSDDMNGTKQRSKTSSPEKTPKKSKNGKEESRQDGTKGKKDFSKPSGSTSEKLPQDKTRKTSSQNDVKKETMSANSSLKTGRSPTKSKSGTKGIKKSPTTGSHVVSLSPSKSRKGLKSPSTPIKNITNIRKLSPRTSPRLAGSPGTKGKETMKAKGKPRGNKYIKQKYKNYPCTQCKVRFTKLENLNKHLRDHQENKRFPCYFCGKNFMNETKMKQHVRYHFGQNVSCRHCPQRFPNVGDMRHHLMTEHEEEWLIKQGEEEEERKHAQNRKKSQRRRTKRVRVISEEDYRKVLTENKMIQPKIKESFLPASSPQSLKILSSPVPRRKNQEDSENEAAANGYKSKYRYSCFTCKKRFISYHSLVQHRKTSHRYDRYKAPSTLLHMKQKVSEERNPIGVLPMISPPVSPDPYYGTIEDNVKTNLTSFLDGHQDSLKNFKRHIQINGYKSINSVSPIKAESTDWTSFNFPFHYEPYESVIGYNKPNHDPSTSDTGSPTFDSMKLTEDTDSRGYLRSGNRRISELRLDIASDDPPILTCMSEMTSTSQIPRRQSAESESSMPSLTPSFSENTEQKFFANSDSNDSLEPDSQKQKKEGDENTSSKYEENLSSCHGDGNNSCVQSPEIKFELSGQFPEVTDMKNSALNSLKHSMPYEQQPSPLQLVAKQQASPSELVVKQQPSPSGLVVKEVDDQTSAVPPLRALNLIQVSHREEVIRKIHAANKNIPAHVFEKEIRETLSAQKWEGFSDNIAFGKLGAVTNVCSVCYRYFDTIEHLFRHQWTKHSSMQYRHLQMEKGYGIDSLFYSWPCNEGLVASSTPVPEDCHSLPVYKCTRCKSSFKSISRLHVHIISCDPQKLFYVQRISFKEKRKLEEKERKRQEKLKVKEEKGKQRKLNRLSQAKAQIQMKRNAEKVKKMIRARKEARSPKKSSSSNSPTTAVPHKISPRNPREAKPGDIEVSAENNGRITRQRKRRNYELLYKPDNHVRRREMADVVETHQCSGCSSKFRTLFLLERHARKCSEKEKLRSLNPVKESKPSSKSNQQHNCQYCSRKFTYLKSLSNHYADFCVIKKEKEKNGQLKQEEVELETLLKEELRALDGSKKESGKMDDQGNVADGETGKKRCGWPRGLKRKHRRKNHCWTYTKKKKTWNPDNSRMAASGEGDGIVKDDEEEDGVDVKIVRNVLTGDEKVKVKLEDDNDEEDEDEDAKNKHETDLIDGDENNSRNIRKDADEVGVKDDVDRADEEGDKVNRDGDKVYRDGEDGDKVYRDGEDGDKVYMDSEAADKVDVGDDVADEDVEDKNDVKDVANDDDDDDGVTGDCTVDVDEEKYVNVTRKNIDRTPSPAGEKNRETSPADIDSAVKNRDLGVEDKKEDVLVRNESSGKEVDPDVLEEGGEEREGTSLSNGHGEKEVPASNDDSEQLRTEKLCDLTLQNGEDNGNKEEVSSIITKISSSNNQTNNGLNSLSSSAQEEKPPLSDIPENSLTPSTVKHEPQLTTNDEAAPTLSADKIPLGTHPVNGGFSLEPEPAKGEVPVGTPSTNGTASGLPSGTLPTNDEVSSHILSTNIEEEDEQIHAQDSELPSQLEASIINKSPVIVQDSERSKQVPLSTSGFPVHESTRLQEREGSNSSYAPGEQKHSGALKTDNCLLALPISAQNTTLINTEIECSEILKLSSDYSDVCDTLQSVKNKIKPQQLNTSSSVSHILDLKQFSSEIKSSNSDDKNIPCDHKLPNNPDGLNINYDSNPEVNPSNEDKTDSSNSVEIVDNNNKALICSKEIASNMHDPKSPLCLTSNNYSTADEVRNSGDVENSGDVQNSVDVGNSGDVENSDDVGNCSDIDNVGTTGDVVNSSDETDNDTGFYNQDTETDTDANYNAETETENDVEIAVNVKSTLDRPEDLNLFTRDYFPFTKVPDFHFIKKESNSKVKDSCDDADQPSSDKESGGNGCLPTIVDVAPDSDVSR